MTDKTPNCPRCQAPLKASASPEGLCPKCLLAVAMGADEVVRTRSGRSAPPPPSIEDLAPHFPSLELHEVIGRGGMGTVYRAHQTGLGRDVALKILSIEGEEDFEERFKREARALASLSHAHIVAVYDSGRAGPYWYLLMELVEGPNLRQVIRAKELASDGALKIVEQLCSALQFAHDHGVVHRDIKPENVLLDAAGEVKVADFGLAKLLGHDHGDLGLTRTQQALGTLHYMAPEQIERPLTVDHRADIYSMGVVFYELLTGELPLGRFQPPSEKGVEGAGIDEVVMKTLEKEPDRRYQAASAVQHDVAAISRGDVPYRRSPHAAAPAGGNRRRGRGGAGWAMVGCVIVSIICVMAFLAIFLFYGVSEMSRLEEPAMLDVPAPAPYIDANLFLRTFDNMTPWMPNEILMQDELSREQRRSLFESCESAFSLYRGLERQSTIVLVDIQDRKDVSIAPFADDLRAIRIQLRQRFVEVLGEDLADEYLSQDLLGRIMPFGSATTKVAVSWNGSGFTVVQRIGDGGEAMVGSAHLARNYRRFGPRVSQAVFDQHDN